MKYSILDLAVATAVTALMLTFAHYAYAWFFIAFLFVHFFLVFGPFAILFSTIAFADQSGTHLDLGSPPLYRFLKRLWILSILSVVVIWLALPAIVGLVV